jgi:uncharacterized membrane protein
MSTAGIAPKRLSAESCTPTEASHSSPLQPLRVSATLQAIFGCVSPESGRQLGEGRSIFLWRIPMAFCPNCGTQIAEGGTCPKCAGAVPVASAPAASGGLADNVAGALAYVTIIPAIAFLVLEPFNKKRFVRFHAFQCIFFAIAWTALWILLAIIGHIPFLGWATLLLWPLISLAGLILWVVLVVKAYQNQMFKLPVIGDMAEKQAGAM